MEKGKLEMRQNKRKWGMKKEKLGNRERENGELENEKKKSGK